MLLDGIGSGVIGIIGVIVVVIKGIPPQAHHCRAPYFLLDAPWRAHGRQHALEIPRYVGSASIIQISVDERVDSLGGCAPLEAARLEETSCRGCNP